LRGLQILGSTPYPEARFMQQVVRTLVMAEGEPSLSFDALKFKRVSAYEVFGRHRHRRCHATTVSVRTMTRAERRSFQIRDSETQSSRSACVSWARWRRGRSRT